MARVLDLNILEQPTLELRLCDAERTTVHVSVPDTDMVKEYQANEAQMRSVLSSGTPEGTDAAYMFAAQIISCNVENKTITAEELRGKYRVNLYGLIAILKAYTAFIAEIEKN